MKIVMDLLLVILALFYECSLSSLLQVGGVGVGLLCALVCSISLCQGVFYGAACGFAAGVLMDALFGHFGFYSAAYLLVGLVAGLMRDHLNYGNDRVLLPGITLVVCYLAKEVYTLVYIFFCDVLLSWGSVLAMMGLGALATLVVFIPLHLGLYRLNRWEVMQAPLFRVGRW